MKNQEITTLIGQKRAYNSSSFLLRVGENTEKSSRNIAILASKKNFKTAVLRNTARRLIKNAIRENKAQISNYSLVFSPKKGFEKVVFKDLVEEIRQSFINNGII